MALPITSIYAALIGILAVVLANYVSISRGRLKVAHGDGGNPEMAVIIRRHANLMENAPLVLILLGLCEMQGMSATWLHVLGLIFLASRLVHPFGLSLANPNSPLRIVGAVGTHITGLATAVYLLWSALSA